MTWRRGLVITTAGLLVPWSFFALLPAPVSFPHPYFSGSSRGEHSAAQIIAHRGGWGLWPEHTLDGYRRAVDLGVDALELDVQPTADDIMVVFHDRRVDRVTGGTGRVDAFTFEQLQNLDAGYHWSPDGGATHPFRGQGLRIPSLDEVLSTFPDRHLVIELKTDDAPSAQRVCGQLRRHSHHERAIVAAFRDEALVAFRQACPEVATSASSAEAWKYWILHVLRLDVLSSPEFEALQVPEVLGPITIVDRRFVEVSQGRGLPVQVWTIDNEETMERLTDHGVQAIMTRRPDLLNAVLEARGHR